MVKGTEPRTVTVALLTLRFLVAIASVVVVVAATSRTSGYPGLGLRSPAAKKANNLQEDASIRSHFALSKRGVQEWMAQGQTKMSLLHLHA